MGVHRNTFEGGMIRDVVPALAPANSYHTALNAITNTAYHSNVGLANERSNQEVVDVGANILGTTYIEQIRKSIIFSDKNGSSVHLFDHVDNSLQDVISDSEFGCSWNFSSCEFMYAEVKEHNACDDIYIYFSSDCQYYVVNITEMLDPVRKQAVKDCEDCSYFRLFQPICTPVINATPVLFSGSTLQAGAVSFALRLTDSDANATNWFAASNTVILRSENNLPGEQSINGVEVSFSGLDVRYEYIEVAVIKTGAGVTNVTLLEKLAYSGGKYSFTYHGQKGTPISLAEITTKTKAYLQGKDIIQHDGRLFFYNLKREKNLNYQKYANQISPSLVVYQVSLEQQLKYRFPSLQRGECYAPAIVWNYNDGTHSKAFSILGNSSGRGKSSSFDNTPDVSISYDTEDAFVRKSNPPNRNTESDNFEGAIKNDISNIDTDEDSLKRGAKEIDEKDDLFCCDDTNNVVNRVDNGNEAEQAITDDIEDVSNMIQNVLEDMAEQSEGKPIEEVMVNKNPDLKTAALELFEKGVENRQYNELKSPTLNISRGASSGGQEKTLGEENRFDNWVDQDGKNTTDFVPDRLNFEIGFDEVFSELEYPDFKDCEGMRMFPGGNIKCYRTPTASLVPPFSNFDPTARSVLEPSADPYSDIKINLLGAKFTNIHIPTDEELPKPLCPTKPYTIVYVKRGTENSTVIANGWTGGTYVGENRGKNYFFQAHGVNSRDYVFRGVDNNGTRFAQNAPTTGYMFHSPDTDFSQGRLNATKVRHNFNLKGGGWRYGIFAKGDEPADAWTGQRVDQRGARVANNLTGVELTTSSGLFDLKGLVPTYHGTVSSAEGSIDHPVDSVYNESALFFQTTSQLPGNERDKSFLGDTLDHEGQLECKSSYVSLIRELPNQYGGIENRAYIPLGVYGRPDWTETEGICGDVFIGPYTKRRTSFVSEKVGDKWNVTSGEGRPFRPRSVCDQPDDLVFELLGLNINQTRLPESSDKVDPRNWGGLYTTLFNTLPHQEAFDSDGPLTDVYYPGTVTGVVYSIVESRVVPWERSTGSPEEDKIFAEKLKGWNLDSAASENRPWERCYLNHVNYVPIFQPSRKQLANIALVRNIIMMLIPAASLAGISSIEGVFDAISTMFVSTGISALFMLAAHTLFTTERLRQLFGIDPCYTDSEGAWKYYKSDGHKDNWNRYNFDYSKQTTENQYLGINSLYNTCDCDSCTTDDINQRGGQTNKEIYYSAKQNLDTEIDAYRNVRIGMYNELPAHAGNIRKIFLQNNNMYVHSTRGIWMVQMAAGNWPADIGSQLTGTGDLLMRPVMMMDSGTNEGFAGTNNPNNSINVPGWGYFFIDEQARKIYRFNGKPEEISAYGMKRFFNNHIPYCQSGDCHDEIMAPKYLFGWDYENDRLLFTKKDQQDDASFTISYFPMSTPGKWISFHSYIPDFYLRDRFSMYSVKNNKIYLHNIEGKFQEYYGVKYPHIIQNTLIDQNKGIKYFDLRNVKIFGEASKDNLSMLDTTFDKAAFWNYNNSTGLLTLNNRSDKFVDNNSQADIASGNIVNIDIIRNRDIYLINNILNNFDLKCDRFVNNRENNPCQVIQNVEHQKDCENHYRQHYDRRNFGGRYINARFIYNDLDDTSLVTHFIEWEDDDEMQIP